MSGSFLLSERGGHRSRTGGLSVSLAGPDGRVLGGGVAGILTAASPVQVCFFPSLKGAFQHLTVLQSNSLCLSHMVGSVTHFASYLLMFLFLLP